MGKILQIRVSVWTYDENEVEKAWPRLVELAAGVPLKHAKHGVTELVDSLDDGLRFMDWPQSVKDSLRPGVERAPKLKAQLEDALADWDPRRADKLSYELEEVLDLTEASCTLS